MCSLSFELPAAVIAVAEQLPAVVIAILMVFLAMTRAPVWVRLLMLRARHETSGLDRENSSSHAFMRIVSG